MASVVRIFNEGLTERLRAGLSDRDEDEAAAYENVPRRTRGSQDSSKTERKYALARARFKQHQEESAAEMRELLEERARQRERRFQRLQTAVREGQELMDEVDKHIQLLDMSELSKKRKMYESWNNDVFGRIGNHIDNQLRERPASQITQRRCRHLQDFLDETNSKGIIFRDIVTPEEYDPFQPNRECIKARPSRLNDPVKRVLTRRQEEEWMLEGPKTPQPLGRKSDLKLEHWASGKIEATPHGFFARMMTKSAGPGDDLQASHVIFDHFNFPTGREAIDKEFPRGKRVRGLKATCEESPLKMRQGL